jgi:hypothetical protein
MLSSGPRLLAHLGSERDGNGIGELVDAGNHSRACIRAKADVLGATGRRAHSDGRRAARRNSSSGAEHGEREKGKTGMSPTDKQTPLPRPNASSRAQPANSVRPARTCSATTPGHASTRCGPRPSAWPRRYGGRRAVGTWSERSVAHMACRHHSADNELCGKSAGTCPPKLRHPYRYHSNSRETPSPSTEPSSTAVIAVLARPPEGRTELDSTSAHKRVQYTHCTQHTHTVSIHVLVMMSCSSD